MWTPVRIGDGVEKSPRWFARAVREAKAPARVPTGSPARSQRPRERRERRSRTRSSGAPPDDPTHLAEPASGHPLHAVSLVFFAVAPPVEEGEPR
jgi:hypothetical protein